VDKDMNNTTQETNKMDVLKKIRYVIVNAERNKVMLKYVPHKKFLDFAVIFAVMEPDNKERSCIFDYSMFEEFNISFEELDKYADFNMITEQYEVVNMQKDMFAMVDNDTPDELCMYMVTNKNRFLGAASILCNAVLNNFAERMNSDFYILPSSRHEVIFVPEALKNIAGLSSLYESVKEANETVVSDKDFLSNSVYKYSREADEITIVTE
jgi:hypothetical protein